MYLPSEPHVSRPNVLLRKTLGVRHQTRDIECLRANSAIELFSIKYSSFCVDIVHKCAVALCHSG